MRESHAQCVRVERSAEASPILLLRCLLMAGFHIVLKVFRMERRMQRYYQSTLASQGNFYVRSKVNACERSKFSRLGRSHNSTTGVIDENSFS